MADPLSPEALKLLRRISTMSADPAAFTAEEDKACDELGERGFIRTDGFHTGAPLVHASAEGLKLLRELITFPRDEQDDFKQVVLRWGHDPNDFEVTAVQEDPPATGGPIRRTVTVVRRSTGKHERFQAGHVSHWVIDFEHALRRGAFT
jgi:hypothetical protein